MDARLLALLGHLNPIIWDEVFPMGPNRVADRVAISATEARALTPQSLSPGEKLQLASVEVAKEIARAASGAAAGGNAKKAVRIVADAIDDLCGNSPKGLPIPWPRAWPFPWPPDPEEVLMPHVGASRVAGALTLASIASRMAEGELRTSFEQGAEKLTEASVSG